MTSFFQNLKLSLVQYGALTIAIIIGVLVALLKLQGSRLHSAQVALLREHFGRTQDLQDAKVDSARAKYEAAAAAYEAAK